MIACCFGATVICSVNILIFVTRYIGNYSKNSNGLIATLQSNFLFYRTKCFISNQFSFVFLLYSFLLENIQQPWIFVFQFPNYLFSDTLLSLLDLQIYSLKYQYLLMVFLFFDLAQLPKSNQHWKKAISIL